MCKEIKMAFFLLKYSILGRIMYDIDKYHIGLPLNVQPE